MASTCSETDLLRRITSNPAIFGGKSIIRNRRLAVEHVLGMLAAGDTPEIVLQGYPWPEPDDIRACGMIAPSLAWQPDAHYTPRLRRSRDRHPGPAVRPCTAAHGSGTMAEA